jgi:hypothetical protein
VGGYRRSGPPGGVGRGGVGPAPAPGELGRIGVETQADLAAALLDERRQPVRELVGTASGQVGLSRL